ncbi:MAG: rhodanese-like domain-containing protein [Bacteroidota bacterium]
MQEEVSSKSCKTPRWRMLKAHLKNLEPTTFKSLMETEPNAVLIDVRTPQEFGRSHFEGAINISYFAEDLCDRLETLDKDKTYLVYCRSGRRSIRVGTLMRNSGFDTQKVYNLDGGLVAWQEVFGE